MKILKIIFYAFIGVLGIYLVMCLMGPSNFNTSRSISIKASPDAVFEEIKDFSKWPAWSVWSKRDPAMKNTYEGTPGTLGHKHSWVSESEGSGSQVVVEVREDEYFKTELTFTDWDGKSYAELILEPEAEGTKVTWTLKGDDLPFMFRGVMLAMGGMDAMNKDYDDGLAGLKSVVEAKPKAPSISYEETEIPEVIFLGKRMKLKASEIDSNLFSKTFGELMAAIGGPDKMQGMPFSIGHFYDEKTGDMDLEIALPIKAAMKAPAGLNCGTIPAGKCIKHVFTGPYEGTAQAWMPFMQEVTKKYKPRFPGYEVYANDPGDVKDPSKYITWLMQPVE